MVLILVSQDKNPLGINYLKKFKSMTNVAINNISPIPHNFIPTF